VTHAQTDARKLRGRLSHPIIDADGHWAEFHPLMRQEFRRIGGDTAVEALDMASTRIPNSLKMSVAERRRRRIGQEAFWFLPTKNTTAMMPRLLYERLDDLGLDFCVVYPAAGLGYYRLRGLDEADRHDRGPARHSPHPRASRAARSTGQPRACGRYVSTPRRPARAPLRAPVAVSQARRPGRSSALIRSRRRSARIAM